MKSNHSGPEAHKDHETHEGMHGKERGRHEMPENMKVTKQKATKVITPTW
jgi:hypothetical protein